ncbi:hypothetical protein HDU67_007418 [Dinochytrium kinnereticum]|nr:hypothetical protein HDU67_007418 [Dinochytrium kinnereticum]
MNRNSYDSDITVWSPQGRLHQIEYAMEAVKQGSAAVGLRSNTHAVLVALNRSSGELAAHQKKLIRIDNHMGVAIAGLTSDARVLRPLPVSRIASSIADKAQVNTQRYGRRPYGVGLLIIGADETGPHLFECSPSGNYFDYVAVAIGARSQSAKTYLEKHFASFATDSLDALIVHGLRSLRDTLQQDKELNTSNCSIGVVGKDENFHIIEGPTMQRYLDMLQAEAAVPAAVADEEPAPMETEA